MMNEDRKPTIARPRRRPEWIRVRVRHTGKIQVYQGSLEISVLQPVQNFLVRQSHHGYIIPQGSPVLLDSLGDLAVQPGFRIDQFNGQPVTIFIGAGKPALTREGVSKVANNLNRFFWIKIVAWYIFKICPGFWENGTIRDYRLPLIDMVNQVLPVDAVQQGFPHFHILEIGGLRVIQVQQNQGHLRQSTGMES